MSEVVTRAEWGARPPTRPLTPIDLRGPTTIHWNGGGTKWANIEPQAREAWAAHRMRIVQQFHQDGRGWRDFAYNFAIDPWGLNIYEGRGLDMRPASQGTSEGNSTSHSIYVMTGLGDGPVTQGCLDAIDEAVGWIAEAGTAEPHAVGHRDWKSTTCPGDFLYSHVGIFDGVVKTMEPSADSDVVALIELEGGYGLVRADGFMSIRGTAQHRGDLSRSTLVAPIVDAESTPDGRGYYMLGADGGVFAFGDAPYLGNLTEANLNAPPVAIEVDEGGYWVVAADGGVFAFGLDFHGSFVN